TPRSTLFPYTTLFRSNSSTPPTNADTYTVTVTITDANYVLSGSGTGSITINKAALTASIIGNPTKPYDGITSATLTSANFSLTPLVTGESITVTKTSGTYNSKDVATAATVTASLAAGDFTAGAGTQLGNYVLPASASGPGHITAKNLTISGAPANNKQEDGNATATVSFSGAALVGVVGLDAVSINSAGYSATFAEKTV